jgi:hypothetical protein
MHRIDLRRALGLLALASLAACGSNEAQGVATPGEATVSAVVQPQQLTLTPVAAGGQPAGAAQAVTVHPVLPGERLDLQPVTPQ